MIVSRRIFHILLIYFFFTFLTPVHAAMLSAPVESRVIYSGAPGNNYIGGAVGTYPNGDDYKTLGIVNLSSLPAGAVIQSGTLNFGVTGSCTTTDNFDIGIFRAIPPTMINHSFSGYYNSANDTQYSSVSLGAAPILNGQISLNLSELTGLISDNRGFIVRSFDAILGHYCPISVGTLNLTYDPPSPNEPTTTQDYFWQTSCNYHSGAGPDCQFDPAEMGSYDGNYSVATLIPNWSGIPANLTQAVLEFIYTPTSALSVPNITVGSVLHGTDIATQTIVDGLNIIPLYTKALRNADAIYVSEGGYRTIGSLTPYSLGQNYKLTLTYSSNPSPTTVTFTAIGDTYIRSGNDNRNEGAEQHLNIQSSGNNRSMVRFNQESMQSTITGSVLSAKIRLTITDNGDNWGASGRTVDVHRLLVDWIEGNGTNYDRGNGYGATWNCAIDSAIQNQAKDCNGAEQWEMGQPGNPSIHPWVQSPSSSQTIINNQTGFVEYDVTSDVASFITGSNMNYGWLLKKSEEGQNGQVSFGSRESSFAPELVVTFQ